MDIATRIESIIDNLENAYTSLENKNATIPEKKNIENLASTIDSIEVGGSPVPKDIEWKDVVFIDFDGTPLYSYTMEEVQELTELPPLPTRKGFTYQGWNWTLEDIKVQNDGAIVGAHCVTSDGLTRFYMEVDEHNRAFTFGICQSKANGFLIDWGDGTSELSGTTTGERNSISKNHTYPKAGSYIITLIPQFDDVELYFIGNTTYASLLIRKIGSNSWISNGGWSNILKKVELGEHFKIFQTYALFCCRGLETINIPKGVVMNGVAFRECGSLKSLVVPEGTKNLSGNGLYYNSTMESISLPASYNAFNNYLFQGCGALKHVRTGNKVTSFSNYCCRECYNLERFVVPDGTTSVTSYAFYNCYNLKEVKVPMSVNNVSSSSFYNCYSLKKIVFEGDITRIDSSAFYRCMNIELYDFRNCSSVPTLSATSAFTNIGDDAVILVPDDLYDRWVEYTNWSNYAGHIVKESEYND